MPEQQPHLRIPLQQPPHMEKILAVPGVPPFEPRPLTDNERSAISPWRQKYMAEPDKTARYRIIKEEIFVAMFNNWDILGEGLLARQQEPERIKMIMGFIHNNWRRSAPLHFNTAGDVVIRRRDLIYEMMRERVDAEITRMLGLLVPVTTSHKEYFASLSGAIRHVSESLTPEDDALLWDTQQKRRKIGHPADVQKRYVHSLWDLTNILNWSSIGVASIFAKSGRARIRGTTATNYKELGVLTWNLIAYKTPDDKWAVCVIDEMASNVQVTHAPIIATWPKEVEVLQRIMLRYVNTLDALSKGPLVGTEAGAGGADEYSPRHDLQIRCATDGYPVMPAGPTDNCTQNVKELALLLRTYLNHHYRIASSGRTAPAPYTRIAADNMLFVDLEYLPSGIPLKDPTNMSKPHIVAFINHVRDRQESLGNANAFRWKAYEHGGRILDAQYQIAGNAAADSESVETPAQKRKARSEAAKARRQAKGKEKEKAKGKGKGKAKGKGRGKQNQQPSQELPIPDCHNSPVIPSASPLSHPHWAHGLTADSSANTAPLFMSEGIGMDTFLTASDMPSMYQVPNEGPSRLIPPLTLTEFAGDQVYPVAANLEPSFGMSAAMTRMDNAAGNRYAENIPIHTFAESSALQHVPGTLSNAAYQHIRGQHAPLRNCYMTSSTVPNFGALSFTNPAANLSIDNQVAFGLGNSLPPTHVKDVPTQSEMFHYQHGFVQPSHHPSSIAPPTQTAPTLTARDMVSSSLGVGPKDILPSKKRKNTKPLQDIQLPSTAEENNRPRKRTKTNDDLAAEEARNMIGGVESLQPRHRTNYKDMMILKAQKM